MRRRSRLFVIVGLMGGVALFATTAPPANAARVVRNVRVAGGDSIAVASANGGNGGSVGIRINPLAVSGDSGTAIGQSSATNTGNTGPASSTSISSPVAISGDSGSTGRTGDVRSNVAAVNTAIKGRAVVDGGAGSGNSGNSGRTGNANAVGVAVSNANSGAQSSSNAVSGDTGNAVNNVAVRATGGNGGNGGDNVRARSGRGGNAVVR
jgi:hypothetical protein